MSKLKVSYLPHPIISVEERHQYLPEILLREFDTEIFDRSKDALSQLKGREVIVDLGGNIEPELVDVAAEAGIKYVQVQTNGLDHVEVERIIEKGMILAHCPGHLSSVSLAEGAMMFILMLAHDYGNATNQFYAGTVFSANGLEVEGRTLTIVGFGASGQQLARRAKALGMKINAIDVRPIEQEILDEIQPDALVCAGYKWLMGPYGSGLAYYGKYFDQGKPIEESWINRKGSDDFSNLINYQEEYAKYAKRYSVGPVSYTHLTLPTNREV